MRRILPALLLAALGLAAIGFLVARAPPVVVRHAVALPGWPRGAAPLRLVFLSDLHVAGPDMPPARLAGIVAQVNALAPDCVLLGGDYVSDKRFATRRYAAGAATAPLAALRPRIATFGVLGNHDDDFGRDPAAMVAALRRAGVRVLENEAARCGPLTIAGVDDLYAARGRLDLTIAAAARLPGPTLLLSHTPDPFAVPAARRFPLVIAGHTHCGQVAAPWLGPIVTFSRLPRDQACGLTLRGRRVLIVGAGLGTSGVPVRLFTRAEIVVVEVGGVRRARGSSPRGA